ncbi:hypothetical protein C8Q79DRAFT_1013887 [Trametes meyenii]|nr:hypothetical protein C8Q79DRAFT_1013887 [Trametes meyenii]
MSNRIQSCDPCDTLNPKEIAQRLLAYVEQQQAAAEYFGPRGNFDDQLFSYLETAASTILKAIPVVKNRYRPVNRLPLEILVKIFSYVPTLWDKEYGRTFGEPFVAVDVRDLLPLAAICHSWRNIILGTPSLWSSFIDSGRGGYAGPIWYNYAPRCGAGTPILLSIRGNPARETLDLLAQEGPRIREISADFSILDRGDVGDIPVELQAASLNELERCLIRLNPRVEHNEPRSLSILCVSRKLRTLHLLAPNFTPSTPFPALTCLTIADPLDVSLSHLLAFLAGTPRLEQLKLSNLARSFLFTHPASGPLPKRVVQLNHLYHLEMSEEAPRSDDAGPIDRGLSGRRFDYRYAFLSRVSYPSTCAVKLIHIRAANVQPFLDLMAGQQRATRARISLDRDPSGHFWSSVIDARSGSARDRVLGVSFTVSEPFRRGPDGARRSLLPRLCTTMYSLITSPYGFANLRKLWMHPGSLRLLVYSDFYNGSGVPLLVGLPKLELLIIRRSLTMAPNITDVLGALRVGDGGTIPCPALMTLAIDCYLLEYVDGRPVYGRSPCTEVDYVRALAFSRMEAGAPMMRLLLYTSTGHTGEEQGTIVRYDNDGELVARGGNLDEYAVELAQEWQAHNG